MCIALAVLRRQIVRRPSFFRCESTCLPKVNSIVTTELDHVCVVAKNMEASIAWYGAVLGMRHEFTNSDHFYPKCKDSPAFLRSGGAKVAILPLSVGESDGDAKANISEFINRRQFGEHLALTVSREEFARAEVDLPVLLRQHDLHHKSGGTVEACDYGHQLSLFFPDLDGNVVELTTWVDPCSTRRLKTGIGLRTETSVDTPQRAC